MKSKHGLFGWALSCFAITSFSVLIVGCATRDVTVVHPDGTTYTQRDITFDPDFQFNPTGFRLKGRAVTDDQIPFEMYEKEDGTSIYRVVPAFGDPLYFKAARPPADVELDTKRPFNVLRSCELQEDEPLHMDELRFEIDLSINSATLSGRAFDGQWEVVASGDLSVVAGEAMRQGMHPIEFTDEFGTWHVDGDSTFPLLATRLNGQIVDVRAFE